MIPLQIVARDFSLTPAIRSEVMSHVDKLERFYHRVQSCEVTISIPHRRRRKGKIYHVAIRIQIPGSEIVVNREAEEDFSHENLRLALHDAFRSLDRRLEDRVHEMRGFVKVREESGQEHGIVNQIFPEQDYGLLQTDGGDEVYFHRNSLKGATLEKLKEGTAVCFQIEEGEKGPQATFVKRAKGLETQLRSA
jgi:ribosomal subunit interface protein